jgi:hypothetical protein
MRVCIVKIWPDSEIEDLKARLRKFKHEIVTAKENPHVVVVALSNKIRTDHPLLKLHDPDQRLPLALWPDDEQIAQTDWLDGPSGLIDMLFVGTLQLAYDNAYAQIDLGKHLEER